MVDIQIKVTIPELALNSAFVRSQIISRMQRKTAPDLQRMFKGTVDGWENKPSFLQTFKNSTSEVGTTVKPSVGNKAGKAYVLVNGGAPAHIIRPRKARMLRYQTGYRAATRPRSLSSRSKYRFGNFTSALEVHHPGFEARQFDQTIADEYAPVFEKDMQEVIRSAALAK